MEIYEIGPNDRIIHINTYSKEIRLNQHDVTKILLPMPAYPCMQNTNK